LKSSLMKIGRGRKTLGEKEKLFVFLSWVSTGITFYKDFFQYLVMKPGDT